MEHTLAQLQMGEWAEISGLSCSGTARRRLLDLGLVRGTKVKAVYQSPFRGPVAYSIRGAVIALRRCDAENVSIRKEKGEG